MDVDVVTGRRAVAESFVVDVDAQTVRDGSGNRLQDLAVTFRLRFPDGPDGDAARAIAARAAATSHDRTCTVGRTVELGTPVQVTVAGS